MRIVPPRITLLAALIVIAAFQTAGRAQQADYPKQSDLPNPYRLVENWPTLPASMNGGHWGELIRADIDPKGNIWVFHRCFNTEPAGYATCVGRTDPPILEFDPSGKLLASFGSGMFAFPHGFTVDRQGNIWASDANKDETVLGKSAKDAYGVVRGHQVFKLSSTGKVLMTMGKEGVAGDGPDTFDQPSGVAIAPNGDIFVTDGHGKNDRVVKFSKDGKFIKTWGRHGSGPGEFDQPHDISIGGSQGRVYVADRSNSRVQIFDQDGNFIAAWKQFGRPSALYVSSSDILYVSDSQSNSTVNPGYLRGITIGSAKDGSLTAFIPDPDLAQADVNRISGASGIVADAQGTIYAADVGPHRLRKYVKNK
ncbi:MAG: peptidyl-alpha-hydroxyglycine alpha-amidating lyase family protein [Acidobacteriia bacterium]|nr:peptidyl-alpha-hydroxyglycine alpha-amidating lyase family protein [Terriglobia bacterium]